MRTESNIINHIDEKHLTWYGHLVSKLHFFQNLNRRMNNEVLPKVIMEWEPQGKKRREAKEKMGGKKDSKGTL